LLNYIDFNIKFILRRVIMPDFNITTRIANKYDSVQNWSTNNPTLLAGEIGIELDSNTNSMKVKVGDGSTSWNNLPYITTEAIVDTAMSATSTRPVQNKVAKEYVDTSIAASIANLVDSAPETLNTLNELANALGNDKAFATTVTNQIAAKYTKPNGGIPKTDLHTDVQESLEKADSAVQLSTDDVTKLKNILALLSVENGKLNCTAPITSAGEITAVSFNATL
jgi:hypothetical protein